MKLIIKLEEIIDLFSVNCYALLMQILFKLIALLVVDQRCGAAYHGTFNRLADKTTILHLRQRNLENNDERDQKKREKEDYVLWKL